MTLRLMDVAVRYVLPSPDDRELLKVPTVVARVDTRGKTVLERADVTVEVLEEGQWRARFFLPPGIRLPQKAKVALALADGRHGQAVVDHIHKALAKQGPRLVEVSGVGALG